MKSLETSEVKFNTCTRASCPILPPSFGIMKCYSSKTVNATQPWLGRAGIVGIPPVSGVVHGAAPFILTARLGRIEELLPLPADEGRRLCFRSRRRQKLLEGAGRTVIIGNVEPGRHSERQQKPYPDAETGMRVQEEARKASRQAMTGTLPLQSRSLTSPFT